MFHAQKMEYGAVVLGLLEDFSGEMPSGVDNQETVFFVVSCIVLDIWSA